MLRLRGVVLDRTLPLDVSRELGEVLDLGMLLMGMWVKMKREKVTHVWPLIGEPVITLFLLE